MKHVAILLSLLENNFIIKIKVELGREVYEGGHLLQNLTTMNIIPVVHPISTIVR